jgi:hypothetical protein
MVSMVSGWQMGDLYGQDVYLVDRIESDRGDAVPEARAIAVLRPTRESIDALIKELKAPKFNAYNICA